MFSFSFLLCLVNDTTSGWSNEFPLCTWVLTVITTAKHTRLAVKVKINLFKLIWYKNDIDGPTRLQKYLPHPLAQFTCGIVVHNLTLLTMAQRGILYKIHKYIEFIIYTYISCRRPTIFKIWATFFTMRACEWKPGQLECALTS